MTSSQASSLGKNPHPIPLERRVCQGRGTDSCHHKPDPVPRTWAIVKIGCLNSRIGRIGTDIHREQHRRNVMNDLWEHLFHAREDVTLAIGLILAIVVTFHILLTKREVASAVGWIGLVWFAPIFGAITYLMFGVNRVRRRARQLRPPDEDPSAESGWPSPNGQDDLEPLERGVGRITGRALLPGTTVQTFQNGDEAYPPMLEAIAAAKVNVGLSSYIFQNDRWGGRFIEALTQAHGRGVAGTGLDRRHRRRLATLADLSSSASRRRPGRALYAFATPLADAFRQPA